MRFVLLAMLVGCGGGGTQGGVQIDAATAIPDAARADAPLPMDGGPDAAIDATPDAAIDATLDSSPAIDANPACVAPASFGAVSPHAPHAVAESEDIKYSDPLDASALPDVFKLVLFPGRGAFAGGYAPQTIQLGGVEATYATCGACVEIFSNVDASNNFAAFYLATSGTLTITSFTPRVTGSLANVDLVHLNDDDSVNADGCTTHIDSLAFDVPVE